ASRDTPLGAIVSPPRYSSVTSQGPEESLGVTTIVSGTPSARIAPECLDTLAMPRDATTCQRPGGPSTASASRPSRGLSSGHSLGERQSYGPHSSTMIAERGSAANTRLGARAPGSGAGMSECTSLES